MHLLKKFAFTKTMTVNYHKSLFAGDMLKVESEIKEQVNERDVCMSGRLFNSKGVLCATSTSIMSMVGIEFVKKLNIMDDNDIKDFLQMVNVSYDEI